MIEAYRVGVTLALGGNVGKVIEKLIEQFGTLNDAVKKTQGSLDNLIVGMRALRREAEGAAAAMGKAATAMERSARSSAGAHVPMGASAREPGTRFTMLGAALIPEGGGPPRRPARPPLRFGMLGWDTPNGYLASPNNRALQVYRSPSTNHQTGGFGAALQGEIIPPSPRGGGPGFNPYGTPFGGQGGGALGGAGGQGGGPSGAGAGGDGAGGAGGRRRHGGGFSHDLSRHAMHAAIGDWAGFEAGKSIFEPTFEYQRILTQLKLMNFSDAQLKAADQAANRIREEVPGSNRVHNLDLIGKLTALTQNPSESIEATKDFAKLGVSLAGLRPGFAEQDLEDLYAAARSGEYRGTLSKVDPKTGRTTLNLSGLKEFIDFATAEAYVSHGTVGVRDILKTIISAGPEGRVMGYQDLAESIALQQSMGSQKLGSALQAYGRQFLTGRMAMGVYHLLQTMGITSKDKATWDKLGIGHIMMLPGAMTPEMETKAGLHPFAFMNQDLIPVVQKFVQQKYPQEWNATKGLDAAETEEMHLRLLIRGTSMISSTDPIARLFAEVLSTKLQQVRDREAVAKDLGVDPATWKPIPGAKKVDFFGTQESDNPIVKLRELQSSWQNLMITIGRSNLTPAVKALDDISHILDSLSKVSSGNPGATRVGLDALATGLVAFNVAVAGAGLVGLSRQFVFLGKGIATFGAGTAAAIGMANLLKFAGILGGILAAGWAGKELNDFAKNFDAGHPWAEHLDKWTREHIIHPFGGGSPTAPSAPAQQSSGGSGAPLMVHITNTNDLMHGISSGQARSAHLPPTGMSGSDLRIDPSGAYSGFIPLP